MIVINLGGEGEVDGAVNVNLLVLTTRRPPFPLLVVADAERALPIRTGVAEQVIARRFPMFTGRTNIEQLAREALRILAPGGIATIMRSNGPGSDVADALAAVGFKDVTLNGQTARGVAP